MPRSITWMHLDHDAREHCTISQLSYTRYTECVRPYDSKWQLDKLQFQLTHCTWIIKLVWVYQVSGERFIWCGEVYRFIWDPAPATVSRVEIPKKFIQTCTVLEDPVSGDIQNTFALFYDILWFGATLYEHKETLIQVLKSAGEMNLFKIVKNISLFKTQ